MMWKHINGREYLYRKMQAVAQSLGPRSEATEKAHAAFHAGRERIRARLGTLTARLNEMAPVNKALGLGRVPLVNARVLRQLDAAGLMGKVIDVSAPLQSLPTRG